MVVDASALLVALADDGPDGTQARDLLRGEPLTAPELIDLEVASALRGHLLAGKIPPARAVAALTALRSLPLRRVGHVSLVGRCWELRDNLTIYDAAYVALAEAAGVRLVTADARLGRSTGPRCRIEVLASPKVD